MARDGLSLTQEEAVLLLRREQNDLDISSGHLLDSFIVVESKTAPRRKPLRRTYSPDFFKSVEALSVGPTDIQASPISGPQR